MGWSDDEDEDILVDLQAIDASVARGTRADREDESNNRSTVADRLVDDEAEADAEEEAEDESQAEDDDDEKKSAVTAAEKEETGNKSQTALLYMVHQMAAQVGKETGMRFSKQVTQNRTQSNPSIASTQSSCVLLADRDGHCVECCLCRC